MKKSLSKLLIYLLLCQALLFQIDFPELVLCFGDDGHISIEKKEVSSCDYDTDEHFSVSTPSVSVISGHNECKDLNLDLHFSRADNQKNKNHPVITNFHLPSFVPKITGSHNRIVQVQSKISKQNTEIITNTILLI